MRALIVTGGQHPDIRFLRKLAADSDLLIGADSGLDILRKAGLVPDIAAGDMDSVSDKSFLSAMDPAKVFIFPRDKDYTDTELAFRLAMDRGCGFSRIAGGGGGRLDHLLAIRALFERPSSPDEWHTGKESVVRLKKGEAMEAAVLPGSTVSVFPLGRDSAGMSSEGLKWPLEGLEWGEGSFGVSNVACAKRVSITAGSSSLLVILPARVIPQYGRG